VFLIANLYNYKLY